MDDTPWEEDADYEDEDQKDSKKTFEVILNKIEVNSVGKVSSYPNIIKLLNLENLEFLEKSHLGSFVLNITTDEALKNYMSLMEALDKGYLITNELTKSPNTKEFILILSKKILENTKFADKKHENAELFFFV